MRRPRVCKLCGGPLPLTKHKGYQCPACRKKKHDEKRAEYRLSHPCYTGPRPCKECGQEFVIDYSTGPTKTYCSEGCRRRAQASRRKTDPLLSQRHKRRCRISFLRKKYGLDETGYNRMFESQGGHCAICGKHQTEMGRSMVVDHDHTTGKVRQLLCFRCNAVLGILEDDLLCEKAFAYLARHKSLRIAESA